jgi:hypothetical protein
MRHNWHEVRCAFRSAARSRRADLALQNSSFADRRADPYQSVYLNGSHLGLAKLHVGHSKKKKDPESGLLTSSKPFVLNDMAERVGFYYRHFCYLLVIPTLPR